MHVMIDIETWDTAPTAIVRAIALLAFASNGEVVGKRLIDARETVDEQLEHGRTVDAGTVAWWRKQGPLRAHIDRHLDKDLVCARSVEQILEEIDAFVRGAPMGDNDKTWSRGRYDMSIIRDLYQTEECDRDPIDNAVIISEPPWPYWAEADVRTLDVLTDKVWPDHPHDPISDAEAQIRQVVNALRLRTAATTQKHRHDRAA